MQTSLCALLLVLSARYATPSQCPASRPPSLRLTVDSRRNLTGHWLISVESHAPQRPGRLVLDVEHGASYCRGAETQRLAISVAVPGVEPPADYRPVAGLGHYKYHLTPLSWEEARETCELEGAHLLIIDSERESTVVKEFFARKPNITGATHVVYIHVGVHDRFTEGQYETILGDPVPTSVNPLWHPGQPNGGAENCVVGTTIGKYADAPCAWKLAFICEYGQE